MNLYEILDMIKERDTLELSLESMDRLDTQIQIYLHGSPSRLTFSEALDEEMMEIVILKAKARLEVLNAHIHEAERILRQRGELSDV